MRTSPGRRLPKLPGLTVSQRLTVVLILMILLVTAAAGAGLWSAASMQRANRVVSRDADLSSNLLNLQTSWLSMVATVNSFSIVLPPAETRQQLEDQANGYDQILAAISAQPLGTTSEATAENQQITQELSQIGAATRTIADQVYRSIQEGNWIAAVQTRQSEMVKLQARFDEALDKLNTNLREEISAQAIEAQRSQRVARNFGLAILLLAVASSLWFGWTNRRLIINPLERLTADIQRIAQVESSAELSPMTVLAQSDEIGDLSRAIAQMTGRVRQSYDTLEERIDERTKGLERRTLQLQVAAEVARDIASTSDPEELLNQAVDLIRDRFGFYHAGVFLTDERHEFEALRAATGDAGREMLARQHKLRIGETGLVGYSALSGEPRIALDVGLDAVHFKNPLLPETRSEVAIPIKMGNRVIGVLDVQSKEPAAFDQDSIATLQVISDQLAIAIQNARLLRETQESLSELERTYGHYDYSAWDRLLQSISPIGYQYDGMKVSPIAEPERAGAETEIQGEPTPGSQPLSLPLRVRGGIIGALDIWPQTNRLSDTETSFLTNIGDRLSQILESARLFEETRDRAAREEAINRLTADFARSLDTDSVLQTAVREMAGLPSVVEATIILETPSENTPDGAKGDGSV
jgi:nitrate/nitrite-specific signal transduction histidine kinase